MPSPIWNLPKVLLNLPNLFVQILLLVIDRDRFVNLNIIGLKLLDFLNQKIFVFLRKVAFRIHFFDDLLEEDIPIEVKYPHELKFTLKVRIKRGHIVPFQDIDHSLKHLRIPVKFWKTIHFTRVPPRQQSFKSWLRIVFDYGKWDVYKCPTNVYLFNFLK